MIPEKDKKIVAAVLASRGKPFGGLLNWNNAVSLCIMSIRSCKLGEVYYTSDSANRNYWQYICTIEEYSQCMEDMARAEWMCKIDSYMVHKAWCKLNKIDTSNKELLAKHCDYSFYDKPSSAERTLINMGYRDCGGELWKPPLGKAPDFINEPLVYTQEMADSQDLPLPEMEFLYKLGYQDDSYLRKGYAVGFTQDGEWFIFHNGKNTPLLQNASNGVHTFHPIKTPEQIKQDKLGAQTEEIAEKHFILFSDLDTTVRMFIAALQKDGYIVEPK